MAHLGILAKITQCSAIKPMYWLILWTTIQTSTNVGLQQVLDLAVRFQPECTQRTSGYSTAQPIGLRNSTARSYVSRERAHTVTNASENPQLSPNPMDLRVSHSSAIEKQSESKGPQGATAQSQGRQANPQLSHRDLVAKYANKGGGVRCPI